MIHWSVISSAVSFILQIICSNVTDILENLSIAQNSHLLMYDFVWEKHLKKVEPARGWTELP